MYEPAPVKPRKRVPLKEADPFKFWGRLRMGCITGGSIGFFCLLTRPYVGLKSPLLGTVWTVLIFVSPLIGIVFHDYLDGFVRTVFTSVFWPQGEETAPAHSQGETLVQQQRYPDAIDWFTARVLETPDDWRAQLRLVELLDEHGNDPERLVEERMRLIRMEEVAQALWIQAVFDQAAHWEQAGRGERAVHLYQSILWKYPDDEAADDASRNIERLRKSGLA